MGNTTAVTVTLRCSEAGSVVVRLVIQVCPANRVLGDASYYTLDQVCREGRGGKYAVPGLLEDQGWESLA